MIDAKRLSGTYFRWMMRLGCYLYIIYRISYYVVRSVDDQLATSISALMDTPMIISAIFVIVTALLFSMLWRWIASNSPESLTTFYNASSGLRMLLALGVVTTYYLLFGQELIVPMALTFMGVYFIQLIIHTAFFTKYLK